MMRLAWVIVLLIALTAATAVVHSRRIAVQADLYRLEGRRLKVRRRLWDQQVRLGRLKAPRQVELRGQQWGLRLEAPGGPGRESQLARTNH